MAPSQVHHHHPADKLARVGLEGFALLDEFFSRPKKSGGRVPATQSYDHQTQTHHLQPQYNVYCGPQVVTVLREPAIDSNQAAQFYGGTAVVDHCIRKLTRGNANY